MTVFLTAINDTLKRVGVIAGDTQNLVTSTVTSTSTGLTATEALQSQSAIQHQVDIMVQLWREGINELFISGELAREAATGSIVLVANQREYALATDFEYFFDPPCLRSATEQDVIYQYPGGYHQMLIDQPVASDWIGNPRAFAMSPATDTLRIDTHPATGDAGDTWYYLYSKLITFTSTMATTALPFNDGVYISLMPAIAQWWERSMKNDFDPDQFSVSLSRAVRTARRMPPVSKYGRR